MLADVAAGHSDSDRFDRALLGQLTRFRPALQKGFEAIEVMGRRHPSDDPPRVDESVLQIAQRLYNGTPTGQRARVAGMLDMVRASTRTFAIRLEQGQELRGVLLAGDIQEIAPLLDKAVVVLGRVQYRPSGRALRIDADEVRAAAGDVSLWCRVPPPRGRFIETNSLRRPQGPRSGVAAVIGHWPGDENDDEIDAWLKEIS